MNHRVVEAKRKSGSLTKKSSHIQSGATMFLISSGLPLLLIEGLSGTAELSLYTFQEQRLFNQSHANQTQGSSSSAAINEDAENEDDDDDDDAENDDNNKSRAKEQKSMKKSNPLHASKMKRIEKSVREIVLDLLSRDSDAALSLRSIRLRTEAALGLVLSSPEEKKDLRRIVESVASGNYDDETENEGTEDERENEENEEHDMEE